MMLKSENKDSEINHVSADTLTEIQNSFQGVADELGIKDEQDVVDLVKEIRAERRSNYVCG